MRKDALLGAVAAALLMVGPAHAASGGASVPVAGSPAGGASFGVVRAAPGGGGPTLTAFSVSRTRIFAYGAAARVAFRIDARARAVPVTVAVYRARVRVATLRLGSLTTGARHSVLLRGETLAAGRLTVRVRSPRLRRGPHASGAGELVNRSHRFPLRGAFSWPGPGGEFGAGRVGHTHQGFDLLAADGTPIVAPRGGRVKFVAYQRLAGYYVVIDGAGERLDYAFMHLQPGSTRVRVGQRVRTGQLIGSVGHTGDATGPHLHFEVWRGAWQMGGQPVDPKPFLRRWLAWTRG